MKCSFEHITELSIFYHFYSGSKWARGKRAAVDMWTQTIHPPHGRISFDVHVHPRVGALWRDWYSFCVTLWSYDLFYLMGGICFTAESTFLLSEGHAIFNRHCFEAQYLATVMFEELRGFSSTTEVDKFNLADCVCSGFDAVYVFPNHDATLDISSKLACCRPNCIRGLVYVVEKWNRVQLSLSCVAQQLSCKYDAISVLNKGSS